VPVQSRRNWDPLVKLTHWGVAAGVVVNGLVSEEGSGLHQWVGYGVGALLLLRWAWGVFGSPEARFSAFPPSPGRAVAHVRDILAGKVAAHRSHNPLGALMVYALWASLAVVIATGVAMTGLPNGTPMPVATAGASSGMETSAREAHEADEDGETGEQGGEDGDAGGEDELMEEIHEVAANLVFVLAALHLLGVVFETRRSGGQIVRAMLPGGSRSRED